MQFSQGWQFGCLDSYLLSLRTSLSVPEMRTASIVLGLLVDSVELCTEYTSVTRCSVHSGQGGLLCGMDGAWRAVCFGRN